MLRHAYVLRHDCASDGSLIAIITNTAGNRISRGEPPKLSSLMLSSTLFPHPLLIFSFLSDMVSSMISTMIYSLILFILVNISIMTLSVLEPRWREFPIQAPSNDRRIRYMIKDRNDFPLLELPIGGSGQCIHILNNCCLYKGRWKKWKCMRKAHTEDCETINKITDYAISFMHQTLR